MPSIAVVLVPASAREDVLDHVLDLRIVGGLEARVLLFLAFDLHLRMRGEVLVERLLRVGLALQLRRDLVVGGAVLLLVDRMALEAAALLHERLGRGVIGRVHEEGGAGEEDRGDGKDQRFHLRLRHVKDWVRASRPILRAAPPPEVDTHQTREAWMQRRAAPRAVRAAASENAETGRAER